MSYWIYPMKPNITFFLILCSVSSLFAGSTNLVSNGNFEQRRGSNGETYVGTRGLSLHTLSKNWDVYKEVPGWKSSSGAGIEIWDRPTWSQGAQSGKRLVELDSHNSSSMYQDIFLEQNRNYELSFWYRARRVQDAPGSFNEIQVNLGNDAGLVGLQYHDNGLSYQNFTASNNPSDPNKGSTNSWKKFSFSFDSNASGYYKLSFSDVSFSNSYGGLIDNVKVISAVPEPSTYFLACLGIGFIYWHQRKHKAKTA